MESEEEENSDSVEIQLVRADKKNYSGIDKTRDSSNNRADSVIDYQSGTGESKIKVLNIVIID